MKEIKVKYFGVLTEFTKKEEESFNLNSRNLKEFKNLLEQQYPGIENEEFQMAVNGEIIGKEELIDEDVTEIALLPAFSGG